MNKIKKLKLYEQIKRVVLTDGNEDLFYEECVFYCKKTIGLTAKQLQRFVSINLGYKVPLKDIKYALEEFRAADGVFYLIIK